VAQSPSWPRAERPPGRSRSHALALPNRANTTPSVASSNDGSTTAGADVGQMLDLLKRNLGRMLLWTLLALAAGIAYLALAQQSYTATSAIFIDPRSRKMVNDEVAPSGLGTDIALFESQVSIIGSDTILRRVVVAEKLDQDPEFAPPLRAGLLTALREMVTGPRRQAEPAEQALELLARKIRVRRAQNTYVVNVDVTADSAVKSARIANALLKAYQDDNAAAKADAAGRANVQIDSRLDELKSQVRNAEIKADAFKRENKIVTSEGGLLNEQQLTKLNTELVAVRTQVAASKARLDEMNAVLSRGASPEALPEAMASPVVQRLREQLATAARREAALSSQLQPRHPVMADARAQTASIRTQISAELGRIATQAQNDYQLASGRERETQRTLATQEVEVAATTTAQIKLRELEREADASREVLRAFLARAKETQEQQNLSIAEARVITPAAIPARPSSPNTVLVLALSGLSGLALAMMSAALGQGRTPGGSARQSAAQATQFNQRGPRLSLDPEQGTSPTLATVPSLAQRSRFGRTSSAVSEVEAMAALADGQKSEDKAFRAAVDAAAVAVRATSVGVTPQVVLMVAGAERSAVTHAALSVSYVRALAGDRTLLIDAASADPYLSTLFAGDLVQDQPCILDSKDSLAEITSRDTRSGLVFLPIAFADLRTLTPGQRTRLASGISRLATDYDFVVIDGGALDEDDAISALAGVATQVLVISENGGPARVSDVASALGIPATQIAGVLATSR
jgi:polysaccharide biosynthesis transport protein